MHLGLHITLNINIQCLHADVVIVKNAGSEVQTLQHLAAGHQPRDTDCCDVHAVAVESRQGGADV